MYVIPIGKANSLKSRLGSHLRDTRRRNSAVHVWLREMLAVNHVPVIECIAAVPVEIWEEAEQRVIADAKKLWPDLLNRHRGGNQPSMSIEDRRELGRKAAAKRDRRIWALKRNVGQALKKGHVSERLLAAMRYAARKRPDIFGSWAMV